MTNKDMSTIQECLVKLYLRLNGYFTTGFIIHSNEKKIEGEIDLLAVRFPFHSQDDTEHNASTFLDVPKNIDIIVAEVKSKGKSLKFNKSLYNEEAIESWRKILNWVGVLDSAQIEDAANALRALVSPVENSQLKNFKSFSVKSEIGTVTFRPILFSPERLSDNNADKFINWNEINNFIWLCLCPSEQRDSCGTRYDFTSWGLELSEIVRFYKNRQISQKKTNCDSRALR